jgi:hypothetical protein
MRVSILVLLISLSFLSKATADYGGQISYKYIGGNSFEFEYQQFYDSQGIIPNTVSLAFQSPNCTINNASLSIVSSKPNSNNCGTNSAGVAIYKGVKTLPSSCSNIQVTYNPGRGNIFNNLDDGHLGKIQVYINDVSVTNSSPLFTSTPIINIFTGQTAMLNFSASDDDGDSLFYRFSSVPGSSFKPGFSISQPFGNVPTSLNSSTGALIVTAPNTQGIYLIAVEVLEYRGSILKGSYHRQIAVWVNQNSSSNNIPTISGINSTSSYNSSICLGSILNFYTLISDADNDSINASLTNPSYGISMTRSNDTLYFSKLIDSTFSNVKNLSLGIKLDDGNCGIINRVFSIKIDPCISTGIIEKKKLDLSVFPNPANSFLFIENSSRNAEIIIQDINGKILNKDLQLSLNAKIEISNLPSGIYFLTVLDNEINDRITKSFVIAR